MRGKNPVSILAHICFGEGLDFRAQVFNTLGLLGIFLSLVSGLFAMLLYTDPAMALTNLAMATVAGLIMWRANVTGLFRRYFTLTVIFVFLLVFPLLFFMSGGHRGGMPCFFVFAAVFTVIMLEGTQRLFFAALEILLYLACFLTAWRYPALVTPFASGRDAYVDILFCFVAASVVLVFAICHHIAVYDRKLRELAESNKQLNSLNRMKMEFWQDISHEMQNPLTTITRGIGFAEGRMDHAGGIEAARDALKLAEEEALRLGRMVSGMVKLASLSGGTESREKLNLKELLTSCAETFRLQLDSGNNSLHVETASGLPFVHGASDQLKQVLINLLMNAARHTKNGEVAISASWENPFVTIRVSDSGEGIPEELLPRVFERGVSSIGGTGYGLSISRTIVEAHGGEIGIESAPGEGTTVWFTLPVYGGQSEVRGP